MMKNVTLIIFLLFSLPAFSQDGPLQGGAGHFQIGYGIGNQDQLSDVLPESWPQLDNGLISIGGSGYAIIKNFVIGGSGFSYINQEATNDTMKLNFSMGNGLLDLGYVIFEKKGMILYPLIGGGGGGITLKASRIENPGWQQLVDNPRNSTELTLGQIMFNFSFGADFFLAYEDGKAGGISVGLRAGYSLSLKNDKWKYLGETLEDAPAYGNNNFYIRLLIGGGGYSRSN